VTAFVDTSALIALLDTDDPAHGEAREAWREAVLDAEGLVATDYVVVEAVAVTRRRWGLDGVRVLLDELIPLVEIQSVSVDDRIAGVNALLAAGRRRLSLVDCVSFVMMRRMGIRDYLGTDPHFDEQGFRRYSPEG
jgi:predicted nucleic acid-binding protein